MCLIHKLHGQWVSFWTFCAQYVIAEHMTPPNLVSFKKQNLPFLDLAQFDRKCVLCDLLFCNHFTTFVPIGVIQVLSCLELYSATHECYRRSHIEKIIVVVFTWHPVRARVSVHVSHSQTTRPICVFLVFLHSVCDSRTHNTPKFCLVQKTKFAISGLSTISSKMRSVRFAFLRPFQNLCSDRCDTGIVMLGILFRNP